MAALAVPPMPGVIDVAQPDGSLFKARIVGNEHFQYYLTPGGSCLVADRNDGFFKHAVLADDGSLVAGEIKAVQGVDIMPEFNIQQAARLSLANAEPAEAKAPARIAPGAIDAKFPTTGTVRGLIILAEFQDVKFDPATTVEYVNKKVNQEGYEGPETYGSVIDYFKEQSGGIFTPEFDIVGPITLPEKREFYGLTEDYDNLFRHSCQQALADFDLDMSRYDVNGDYTVDFLFVIFAGHGQAQGGPAEAIWPAMKDLTYFVDEAFDGLYLGVAACSCELKGAKGNTPDGIGTICHEFSHILGLPDIYDAALTGGHGMGHFDLMCYGPYNNDGFTPGGYTAMDKFTLGWIEPKLLEEPATGLTLRDFSTTNDCYFFVNPDNKDEYYTLENRQNVGFDSGLPGHGLVISYVHYVKSLWAKNNLNSPMAARYEHVAIVAADNKRELDNAEQNLFSEHGDTWPGTSRKTAFTDNTIPAAIWQSSGKSQPAGLAITNITESEDGLITFDFNASAAIDAPIVAQPDQNSRFFNLQGVEVPADRLATGAYIERLADGSARKIIIR